MNYLGQYKMNHRIDYIDKFEYKDVVDIWEASVKETHHFLKEEDISYFKPLILNTYLDTVELRCLRDEDCKILGFLGASNGNLEMLFIHPTHRGKRIGKTLLEYAINILNVSKVESMNRMNKPLGFTNTVALKPSENQNWMPQENPIQFYIWY